MIVNVPRSTTVDVAAVSSPDSAFAARPRLLRLRDALTADRPSSSYRWGEPPVFFFDRARQVELEEARSQQPRFCELSALLAEEMAVLIEFVEVRRVARAIPGLREAALASPIPAAKELAELLAVPDDETVLVLDPARRTGFRVFVRGIADAAQFQLRFLDVLGERGTPMQLFHISAVQRDGSVPAGFRGADHWLWPQQPLASVPRIDGERILLLGDAAFAMDWLSEPRYPDMAAEILLLDVLNPFQVAERLGRLAGHPVAVRAAEKVPNTITSQAA